MTISLDCRGKSSHIACTPASRFRDADRIRGGGSMLRDNEPASPDRTERFPHRSRVGRTGPTELSTTLGDVTE
jgi:hypothetical protein